MKNQHKINRRTFLKLVGGAAVLAGGGFLAQRFDVLGRAAKRLDRIANPQRIEALFVRQIITSDPSASRTIMWQSEAAESAAAVEWREKDAQAVQRAAATNEKAGIHAGQAVYINAHEVNLNGLVQSGYSSYTAVLDASHRERVEAMDRAWQKHPQPLDDASVRGNERYLVREGGAVYDTTAKAWKYQVAVYYNPSTRQLLLDSVKTDGGQVYIAGRVGSTAVVAPPPPRRSRNDRYGAALPQALVPQRAIAFVPGADGREALCAPGGGEGLARHAHPKADGFADDAREAFVDRVLPGQDRRPPAPLVGAEAPHRDDRLRVPGTGQALRDGPHRGEIRRLRGRVAPREGEQIPQAGVA